MSDDHIIRPGRTEHYSEFRNEAVTLGCMNVQTSRGVVHVHDAPGLTTVLVSRARGASTIGVLAYNPGSDPWDLGFGLIAQLDAAAAREIAASLLRLADDLDAGGGKQ